jgi:hypothetical protein
MIYLVKSIGKGVEMLREISSNLPVEVKTMIITIITSILTVFISSFIKYIYSNYSLNYKLKREYIFCQNKLIKEEIAKYKMYLLNSCEEFNDRLWNFSNNIEKNGIKSTKKIITTLIITICIVLFIDFWYYFIIFIKQMNQQYRSIRQLLEKKIWNI